MRECALRAIAECRRIAAVSEEPGRTVRRFLTPPMRDVHAHLAARMRALGMEVRVDAAGNLRGLFTPHTARPGRLMMGSHIDTVPGAGAFDGVLGVAVAIEWVEIAQRMRFPVAIEVIAFSEEEGVRFGVPFIGSRAVAGRLDRTLLALRDSSGVSVEEAIRAFGLDPLQLDEAVISPDALGFVEVHIEQGPVLEAQDLSVAAVSAIAGQTRGVLCFKGGANHAGTTPMHMRRDALAAAAEWIGRVEDRAKRTEGLVATVGSIAVEPNAVNVIPGSARVSLDIRHESDRQRSAAVEELIDMANRIAERRNINIEWKRQMDEPSVPMDERLTSFMTDAIEAAGFPAHTIPSGAGHDAMVLASRVPAAMLFVRSPGGISHHPDEAVREEDVEAALLVGEKFLARMAASVG